MPTITSKNTSVNSKQVPAIYNKLNWHALTNRHFDSKGYNSTFYIFDIGCGRNPFIIENYLMKKLWTIQRQVRYLPFDPYWLDDAHNYVSLETWYNNRGSIGCIICSNVLNVIQDDKHMMQLLNTMHKEWQYNEVPYFITVYEGDKTGTGKLTKQDCWQRNMRAKNYVNLTGDAFYEGIHKEVICPNAVQDIIIK